ncbi:MAG: NINE protein [Phycisphaerales bacterium]
MDTAKDSGIAYLLWLLCFAGFFGVHRFYVGKWGTGLLWLFTGGLLFVGQFVDLFLIPRMVDRKNRRLLARGELVLAPA